MRAEQAGVAQVGTKVRRRSIHLLVSERELVLSLLQGSVVHPLFDQAFRAGATLLGGRLVGPLRLTLLTKIIGGRGRLIPASARHDKKVCVEEVSGKPLRFGFFRPGAACVCLSGAVQ